MACKAFLRVALLVGIMLLYLLFWYACEQCIYVLATASCALCFLGGAQYLAPACATGIVCSLFKGVHLGAGPFHFDVHWDV